jgi:EmrB/QacA subfamily drug resistance transporter
MQGKQARWILVLLCATYFIVILDAAIVRVAIPSIEADLGLSEQGLQWVANSYMVVFGGLLLLGGRIADLLGRRRVLVWGLIAFGLASLWCGFAWSGPSLIAARAAQGLGAAAMTPAALSILMNSFPEGAERNKALGAWVAAGAAGASAGWVVGGPLTDGLGWEWIFWVNVPVAFGAALVAQRALSESRDVGQVRSYDPAGALSITGSMVILMYAIAEAPDAGWGSVQTLSLLAVSAVLLGAFVVIERRAKVPLVPLVFFRSRLLVAANIGFALASACIYGMVFILSLYAQEVLDYSALEFGFAGLVLPVAVGIGAQIAQVVATKRGPQILSTVGMSVLVVAFLMLAALPLDASYLTDMFPALLVFGFFFGLAFNSYAIATLMGVGEREAGLAAGLNNTSEMMGGALGTALMATVAVSTTSDVIADGEARGLSALNEGFQSAFTVGIAFAVIGAIVSILFLRTTRPSAPLEPAPAESVA